MKRFTEHRPFPGEEEAIYMFILTGILCLLFLCSSILILSSFSISAYEQKRLKKHVNQTEEDDYSYLFDIYE